MIRSSATWTYLRLVKTQMEKYLPLWEKVKKDRATIAKADMDTDEYFTLRHINEQEEETLQEMSLIITLFSALTLEAHINDYGLRRFGEDAFDALDKMSTIDKWLVFPQLLNQHKEEHLSINKSDHRFGLFKRLFKERSYIVHAKSKAVDLDVAFETLEESAKARDEFKDFVGKCLSIIEYMASEAKRVDPDDIMFGLLVRED